MVNTNNILRLPFVILFIVYSFFLIGKYDTTITESIGAVYETVIKSVRVNSTEVTPLAKEVDPRELKCMADNIYFEAGNQSSIGKIAVGRVVLNRLEDKRFPGSVCGVVYQKVKTTCQFSWVCGHRPAKINNDMYTESKEIAYKLLAYNSFNDSFKNIIFYHADYVNPGWSKKFKVAAKIDNHIFYKE